MIDWVRPSPGETGELTLRASVPSFMNARPGTMCITRLKVPEMLLLLGTVHVHQVTASQT